MAGWNDASFADVDWTDLTFLLMFLAAIQERADVSGATLFAPETPISGSDLQLVMNPFSSSSFIAMAQSAAAGIAHSGFIRGFVSGVPDKYGGPNPLADYTTLFDDAGLDPTLGFERRRPREVATAASTVDAEGNTAMIGQRAYLLDVTSQQGVVEHDGTSWVPYTGVDGPDVLSNYSAAPDAITSSSGTTTGMIQVGDYIGAWIWEDLRDVLNTYDTTLGHVTITANSDASSKFGSGGGGSYAAAFAAAATAFSGATPTTASGAQKECSVTESGGAWSVTLSAIYGGTVTASAIDTAIEHDVQFYSVGTAYGTFDANGDPVGDLVYTAFGSSSGLTFAASVNSAAFGSLSEPNHPAFPATGTTTNKGYVATFDVTIRWQFVYRP